MGNAITANVHLDHELHFEQEAIEAGKSLTGKVIIQVQVAIDPTNLTMEVNGKEKTTATVAGRKLQDKHCFFRSDVDLYRNDDPIEPNIYVFPFCVPLPKSLPASRSHEDTEGSFNIVYSLKLKTKAKGKFPNKRTFEVISAANRDESVPCLLQPKPIEPEALGIDGDGMLFLGAHVRDTNVFKGQELQCSLACRNETTLRIDKAILTLEEEYYYTAKSFGGHGTANIVEKNDFKKLPGIRVIGIQVAEIEDRMIDEETLARRMFRDLKSKDNIVSLTIPQTIQESYSGVIIQVSHFLKFSIIPRDHDDACPSIRIPIHVGSEGPVKKQTMDLNSYSDHVSERARVRFPVAKALPEFTVVGRNAGVLEGDDSFSQPIPSPVNAKPSVSILREEMAASINDYDYLVEKMKDLDWAIFFASFSADDYGSIISLVGTDFAQPRVAALLARNYGGDFTCAHCAAAIRNVAPVFRSNVVEGLLTYCSDLSENNHLIRNELTDFEQIIVALHALNEDDGMEEDEDVRDRSQSGRQVVEPTVPTDIIVQMDSDDEEKPPSEMTLDIALTKDSSKSSSIPGNYMPMKKASSTVRKKENWIIPKSTDVLIGVKDHEPTIKLFNAIQEAVDKGDFAEYCPPVYRWIKGQFDKNQRFLVRPNRSTPSHWREATNIELIEHMGNLFDTLKEEKEKNSQHIDNDGWYDPDSTPAGDSDKRNGKKRWQQALKKDAASNWELAVTVHTYTSGIDGSSGIVEPRRGPSITDVCFFKPKHPGNAILIRSIRVALQQNPDAVFAPPIYRIIKNPLGGRRFFVRVGERTWREATQIERRENIERYFEIEKKRFGQRREQARVASSRQHSNGEHASTRRKSGGAEEVKKPLSRQSMMSPDRKRGKSPGPIPSIERGSPHSRTRKSVRGSVTSPRSTSRKLAEKESFDGDVVSPKSSRRILSPSQDSKSKLYKSSSREGSSGGDRISRRSVAALEREGSSGGDRISRRSSHSPGANGSGHERRLRRSTSAGKYAASRDDDGSTPRNTKPRRSNSLGKFSPSPAVVMSPRVEKRRTNIHLTSPRSRNPNSQSTGHRKSMSTEGPPIESIELNSDALDGTPNKYNDNDKRGNGIKSGSSSNNSKDKEEIAEEGHVPLKGDKGEENEVTGFRRLFRRNSIRDIARRNMRHPRNMDICHGSPGHPGTKAWMEAVLKAVHRSAGKAWSTSVYKGIQKDLPGRRFFLKDHGESSPWREATAEERVHLTKVFFEAKRRERRG